MLLSTPFLGFVNHLPVRKKKEKGKEVCSKILLSSPAFSPAGELYSIGKMDRVKTKAEKSPKTDDALEMSAHGSRRLGEGGGVSRLPSPGLSSWVKLYHTG